MAEIDTSSYPHPAALPTQKGILDQIGDYQKIQSNNLTIDKQRLDLANQHYEYLIREITSLGPNPTKEEVVKVGQDAVKQGLVQPDMYSNWIGAMPTDPSQMGAYAAKTAKVLLDTQNQINENYGTPGSINNGQQTTPIVTRRIPARGAPAGISATGLPIQQQIGPGTETVDPSGQKGLLGPQAPQIPAGGLPVSRGIPGQYNPNAPIVPNRVQTIPAQPIPNVMGDRGPSNDVDASLPNNTVRAGFNDIRPRGPVTGLAPGVAGAKEAVGISSGQNLAHDLEASKNFQREIFPLAQAIPALEKLGTKGTGPGTETINQIKSFILSNVPGVKESDPGFSSVPTYDKAKKYLTDFVNQTGSSGTNDKLAAAFAGNPSVGISNAGATEVAKSALALSRMKQAVTLEAVKNHIPEDQYSRWAAQRGNTLDPRAFGIDLLSKDARDKLFKQLQNDPKEFNKFKESLQIAHDNEFITPKRKPE